MNISIILFQKDNNGSRCWGEVRTDHRGANVWGAGCRTVAYIDRFWKLVAAEEKTATRSASH